MQYVEKYVRRAPTTGQQKDYESGNPEFTPRENPVQTMRIYTINRPVGEIS
jgi:hypothetical protein